MEETWSVECNRLDNLFTTENIDQWLMIREHRAWRQGEQKAVTKRPQLRKDSQNSWAFRDIISS